jgi:hypothetical protein
MSVVIPLVVGLNVIMLIVVILTFVLLSDAILCVIMLSVIMLNVSMLSFIMSIVAGPFFDALRMRAGRWVCERSNFKTLTIS